MGCACLRGGGHHWLDRGARRVAAERRQGGLARKPDAAGPDARSHLLRAGGDPDAVGVRVAEGQSDAVSHPDALAIPIPIGKPIGDRDRQRLSDSLSIAGRHGDALTVAQRQRETFGLTLSRTAAAEARF
jgi:hypothetical protein